MCICVTGVCVCVCVWCPVSGVRTARPDGYQLIPRRQGFIAQIAPRTPLTCMVVLGATPRCSFLNKYALVLDIRVRWPPLTLSLPVLSSASPRLDTQSLTCMCVLLFMIGVVWMGVVVQLTTWPTEVLSLFSADPTNRAQGAAFVRRDGRVGVVVDGVPHFSKHPCIRLFEWCVLILCLAPPLSRFLSEL